MLISVDSKQISLTAMVQHHTGEFSYVKSSQCRPYLACNSVYYNQRKARDPTLPRLRASILSNPNCIYTRREMESL